MEAAKKTTLSIAGERPAWAPTSTAPVIGLRRIGRDEIVEVPAASWSLGTRIDAGHHVVLDDHTVSSNHCRFEWQDRELWVQDLGSKNGTFVNGAKVTEARVIDGSVLVIGRCTFVAFAEGNQGRRSREEILDGRDAQFRIAVDTAIDAALAGHTVIAVGEAGCGRQTLARAIHEVAVGPHLPFIQISLRKGDVPDISSAPAGTLFVEDLANLPTALYGRIVGLMRSGRPSIDQPTLSAGRLQIVVSSSATLWPSSLPDDTVQVTLPPLRDRGDDVLLLMDRFAKDELGHAGGRRAFGKDVLAALRSYQWPGNIAELREAVSRLAAIAKHRSVRAAAEALGVSKSALSDWLYRRGIPTPHG